MKRLLLAVVGCVLFGLAPLVASYNFPNSTDKITAGTTAYPTTASTLTFWLNPNIDLNDGNTHYFFDVKTGADSFSCATVVGLWACGWVTGASNGVIFPAYALSASTWYAIAVTVDDTANEIKLYVNGVQAGSTGTTVVTHTTTGVKTIGDSTVAANNQSTSRMAHVAWWSSVLSGADLAGLAAGGCPTSYSVGTRVSYLSLVSGSLTDQWGPDNGTASGAVSSGTDPTVCSVASTTRSMLLLGVGP